MLLRIKSNIRCGRLGQLRQFSLLYRYKKFSLKFAWWLSHHSLQRKESIPILTGEPAKPFLNLFKILAIWHKNCYNINQLKFIERAIVGSWVQCSMDRYQEWV